MEGPQGFSQKCAAVRTSPNTLCYYRICIYLHRALAFVAIRAGRRIKLEGLRQAVAFLLHPQSPVSRLPAHLALHAGHGSDSEVALANLLQGWWTIRLAQAGRFPGESDELSTACRLYCMSLQVRVSSFPCQPLFGPRSLKSRRRKDQGDDPGAGQLFLGSTPESAHFSKGVVWGTCLHMLAPGDGND